MRCACGCGKEVNSGRRFVSGHNFLLPWSEQHRVEQRNRVLGKRIACRTPETTSEKRRAADRKQSIRMKGNRSTLGLRKTEEQRIRAKDRAITMWKNMPEESRNRHSTRISEAKIKHWQNPDYVSKQMRARECKPNKAELKLEHLLNHSFPKEWKFVGDGQLIIGGKCPDYTNINGKKALIELYGTYWHRNQNPQFRIDHFAKYGYKCLVIWENELKDPEKMISRVKEYFYV